MTIERADRDRLRRRAEAVARVYRERNLEIRAAAKAGASYSEMAEAVGLSKSAVAKIVNRQTDK